MRLANTRGKVLGVIAVLVGLTACGAKTTVGASPAGVAEPSLRPVAKVTDWRQIALPLDAYVPSLRDAVLVERAVYKQTKVCAQRFGLTFNAPFNERDTSALKVNKPTHYRLYGLLDEAHAVAEGYRVSGSTPRKEYTYSKQVHASAYYNVIAAKLGGGTYRGQRIPDGGCIGEARRGVAGGGPAFDASLPERLSGETWLQSNSDSRVITAFVDWSACMARSGFHYRTPMEANDDDRWSGNKASKTEIAVAVADVRCKKQTNLTGIRMAVDSAYQRVMMNTHAQELAALTAGQQRQLRTAARIIAAK